MKIWIALLGTLVVAAMAVPAASARTWNRADAAYVEYHLTTYWNTDDGESIVDANCEVWRGHDAHAKWEYGEWFASAWNCKEVDDVQRLFYVHVRVNRHGGLHVLEYRCDDSESAYACP